MRRAFCFGLAVIFTLALTPAHAQVPSAALRAKSADAAGILAKAGQGTVRIIVQHQGSTGPGHQTFHTIFENLPLILNENRATQSALITSHFGPLAGLTGGGRALRMMEVTPAFAINATAAEVDALANDPRVVSIAIDKIEKPILIQTVPLIGMTTAYGTYNATGSGFAVAIIDSGVDKTHTFLANVIAEACYSTTTGTLGSGGSASVCPNGASSSTASGSGVNCTISWAGCEHGTHVAGIAAGFNTQYQSGQPANGVAKSAGIIAIKAASRFTGSDCSPDPSPCIAFWDSDMQAALDHVYAIRNSLPAGYQGVAAANLSIGGGDYSGTCDSGNSSFKASIDNLRAANIATVIAAGNDSKTSQISFPACISSAIAVAASSKNDKIASYTNINSQVAVFAPGGDFNQPTAGAHSNLVLSSVPSGYSTCSSDGASYSGPNPSTGGTYCYLAGTSMATPHVTGAFAAIRSALPNATVSQILSALESTGLSIADTRNHGTITKPRIRVDQALQSLASTSSALLISPTGNIAASGPQGGPFSPGSFGFTIKATYGTRNYSITGVPAWLTATATSGAVNTTGTTVTFSVNSSANALCTQPGSATIVFTDTTGSATAMSVSATLTISSSGTLAVTPGTTIASAGTQGGPFSPSSFQYQLSASRCTLNYSISGVPSWLNVSPGSGTLTTSATTVTFTVSSNANSLSAGGYNATINFTNTSNGQGNQTRGAALTVNSPPPPPPPPTATRTWVSGTGSDSNNCSLAAPCATFAGALAKTAAGGEINCLDSGGFGGLTITQSVSIVCKKVEAGVSVSGANGIVVNAGATDTIELNGLDISGNGTGVDGVYLVSGGTLRIINSLIRGFQSGAPTGNGVLIAPSTGAVQFVMDRVTMSENGGSPGGNAVVIQPTGGASVFAAFTDVSLTKNAGAGITLDGTGGTITALVSNSVSSNGQAVGLSAVGTNTVNVLSNGSSFTGNGTGIAVNGTGVSVTLTRSAVKSNTTGLTVASGAIASYGDNEIDGNTADGAVPSSLPHN